MILIRKLIISWVVLSTWMCYAEEPSLLKVNEAFVLNATAIDSHRLQLNWQIAEGYYLYRDKLRVQTDTAGIVLGDYRLPPAEKQQDNFFGEIEVYRNQLALEVPILSNIKSVKTLELTIFLQGCPPADNHCYPPQRQIVTIPLPTPLLAADSQEDITPVEQTEPAVDFLDPEIAFVFSARLEAPHLLIAQWEIADGYYLYRDRFSFSANREGVLGEPELPTGEMKKDPLSGEVEVYYHQLIVKIPFTNTQGLPNLLFEANYQGCADAGLCYPPTNKSILLELPATESSPPTSNFSALLEKPQLSVSSSIATPPESQLRLGTDERRFLKGDQAFILSAESSERSQLLIRWQIASGYYLYRSKFYFTAEGNILGEPQWPPTTLVIDPELGEVQVYRQPTLEIPIPLTPRDTEQKVTFSVEYQGCAEAGLCYPPVTKTLVVPLGIGTTISAAVEPEITLPISEQDYIVAILLSGNIGYTLLAFFGFGLLLSLTPCVFPMVPILSSLIVGQGNRVSTRRAFVMSLTYVLAVAITYAIIGAIAGLLGENLQLVLQNPWMTIGFVSIFVLLALSMFGFYELQLPSSWQTKLALLSNRQQGGTLLGVSIMGILSALVVGPCVAAPLAGALMYISQTRDALLGGLALFCMSLGMGVPLLLIGTSAGHWLPKTGEWMNAVKAIFGVLLLAVAIWMLEWMLISQVTLLLWAALLITSAVYMGTLDNLAPEASGWRRLWKGIGFMFFIYGILLLVGVASGAKNPLKPLEHFRVSSASEPTSSVLAFKRIKGFEEFQRELTAAKAQGKPVMLDFYADWCISCKEMEHLTFTDVEVQKILKNMILLQADVTANDAQDKTLYAHFNIFGPPAILFFSAQGEEQIPYRIIGFMPAQTFHQHLQKVFATL